MHSPPQRSLALAIWRAADKHWEVKVWREDGPHSFILPRCTQREAVDAARAAAELEKIKRGLP